MPGGMKGTSKPGKFQNSRYAEGSSDLSGHFPLWSLTKGVVTYSPSAHRYLLKTRDR